MTDIIDEGVIKKTIPQIFVVGATSYIGRRLMRFAQKVTVANGTSRLGTSVLLPMCLENTSTFDYQSLNPGTVAIFTAGISAPDICAQNYNSARVVNVDGTCEFIEKIIARGLRVIFFSSDAVYGEQVDEFDEQARCNTSGEYAEMKREVEKHFSGSKSFKSIRLSYVFSREDKFSSYLAECVDRNEEADIFHPFFRAIVHRDDVIEGALALAALWDHVPEQIINFGGPQVLSRIEFAECLREIHLHDLRFKVTEPGSDFFKNRPQIIAMASPVLSRLLGRPPRTLREAAHMEFASSSNAEKFL